jgi:hypothetical protein
MADDMGWWAVPLVAFVAFTLYGIEGIAQTFEDPFGINKNDIKMTAIIEDARREVEVLISVWQNQNHAHAQKPGEESVCNMFVPGYGGDNLRSTVPSNNSSMVNLNAAVNNGATAPLPTLGSTNTTGTKKVGRRSMNVKWASGQSDLENIEQENDSGNGRRTGATSLPANRE